MVSLDLTRATLCVQCEKITDARGSVCPVCASSGSLLSLARVLNPSPELGSVTFMLVNHVEEAANRS